MSNMIAVPTSYTVVEATKFFSSMRPTIQGFMSIFITIKTITVKNTHTFFDSSMKVSLL
jgi:hypothetical protein